MIKLPEVRLHNKQGAQPKPILMGMPRRAPARLQQDTLAMGEFLQRYPLPPRTAAIGYCDNGLPMLFDLADARTGPLLVLGDSASGKSNLARVLLASAIHNNPPQDFQYLLIADRPDEYAGLSDGAKQSGHCLGCYATSDQDTSQAIINVASIAEERYNSDRPAPAMIVVMDDLRFTPGLDIDTRLNFEWLLKHGPPVQIWPVALLATQAALDMGRWISHFRTRLIGNMPQKAAHRLSLHEGIRSDQMLAGKQFCLYIHNSWLCFWTPAFEADNKAGGQNEDRDAVVR